MINRGGQFLDFMGGDTAVMRGRHRAHQVPLVIPTIVSQPSKCLKLMTFREGCFVIRN